MAPRRWLLSAFGLLGGLVSGAVVGAVLHATIGQPAGALGWAVILAGNSISFWVGALIWRQATSGQSRARARAISSLSQGDLTLALDQAQGDLRRLMLSLRRALSEVQRVTGNVHRTCREVGEQVRMLLEAARRQGSAVDRTLTSVSSMGESLQSSGKRVSQLDAFAQETTTSLSEMTERIEQVALALTTLNEFAHKTSDQVLAMSERLSAIAASGDELARFANEAENFVSVVEGGIDSVRRRAKETGDLAREVTSTAERGQALVGDSVKGLYRIEESVRKAAQIVDALGARSTQIGRVVDVIQEVADQTNLLSLNAAIIAAQSGESGRSFGVVADAIRGLAERTARSTREIASLISGVRGEVESIIALVKESQDRASAGVQLGDRAAASLKEIRVITGRTFAAVEATVAETARLETQGRSVVEASRRVARRVDEVTRAAVDQAAHGRDLVRHTQEMARVAESASAKAEDQAKTGRDLSDSVLRLTAAIDEIRGAQQVLSQGDAAIGEEVAQVREDARKTIRIADSLSRGVDQLSHEANGLESEVFRFRLPTPQPGGTLRAGVHQAEMFEASRGLDPIFTLDSQMAEISANLFSTMLRLEDGVLVPGLAERWEADPSARRYRFFLRNNVLFHDGVAFQATHVKRHFERLLSPSARSPDQWILKEVEGAKAFIEGRAPDVAGFEVLDEHTLEIRLDEPKAFFLHLVTLPGTAIARIDGRGQAIGTGPFRPVRVEAHSVELERHSGYFVPDQPLLERLEFRFYRDRVDAMRAVQSGEVQLASGLYAENVDGADLAQVQVVTGTIPSCWFLGFNTRDAPFHDVRVRQAIRAGIDIQQMVQRFHPGARVARTLTPPGVLDDPEALPAPRPDPATSARLLREAGLSRLRLNLYYPPGRETQAEDAVLFQPLIDAGLVELSHVLMPSTEFWTKQAEGRVPSFRAGWIADYPDPDNFLYFLLNSAAQTVYALGYINPEIDRLTAEARISIDPEQRSQLYRKAERILQRDCPLIPLYHERIYATADPHVQGLRLQQTPPQVRYETLWLDRG